jgi:drug/metabolite transporter superfamily protein YnfA
VIVCVVLTGIPATAVPINVIALRFVDRAVLWGWGVDRIAPDRFDLAGALICLGGVAVIR